jgi:hypothetical protein
VAVNLELAYPKAQTIHLVLDNLNIHSRKILADVFGAEMAAEVWDRFTVHYKPTHGSWLNQAEIVNRNLLAVVPGKTTNPQPPNSEVGGQSLEPSHEPGWSEDQLDV